MTSRLRLLFLAGALALVSGCKRQKPPVATQVWLGPAGGCVALTAHPKLGTLACWGTNDRGQLGDGTTTPRPIASPMQFKEGAPTELALGARHGCGVFDGRAVACWGDASDGQTGAAKTAQTLAPYRLPDALDGASSPDAKLEVRVGGAHTCVRAGDRLRCFGANADGQVGGDPEPWSLGTEIRAFALGEAHTCVAYGTISAVRPPPLERARVVCRGRGFGAGAEPLLDGVAVTALSAGADHTCALLADRTVRCWGKNDGGQLGDGTTTDASSPVAVTGLRGALQIACGSRHSCARLGDNTIWCWGDNAHHQLVNGTTQRSTRPGMLPGVFGVAQIAAAGDSSCARLGDGDVRCWGANDRGQLGDNSTVEHDVPMPPAFR